MNMASGDRSSVSSNIENSSPFVNLLPTELLADILDDVRNHIRTSEADLYRNDWIAIFNTCRHWREVACSSPWLWRIIDVHLSDDWLTLCLSRAAGAWTHIYFHNHLDLDEKLTSLLTRYIGNIRSLSFAKDHHEGVLCDLLSKSAAMLSLTHLQIEWSTNSGHPLPAFRFERLRSLHLFNVRCSSLVEQLPTVAKNLCRLTLKSSSGSTISVDKLLAALPNMPMLEQMDLSGVFSKPASDNLPSAGTVLLPRLQDLYLTEQDGQDHPSEVPGLLTSFCLPTATTVSLQSQVYTDSLTLPRRVSSVLLPLDPRLTFPMLTQITSIKFEQVADRRTLTAHGNQKRPTMTLQIQTFEPVVEDFVADAIALCAAGARVTNLTFNSWRFVVTYQEGVFKTLFQGLPLLETLDLILPADQGDMWEDFRCGLRSTLAIGEEGKRAGGADGETPLCCPRLRSVRIADYAQCDGDAVLALLRLLVGVLRDRITHSMPLERLAVEQILPDPRPKKKGYSKFRKRYIRKMEKLVASFSCTWRDSDWKPDES